MQYRKIVGGVICVALVGCLLNATSSMRQVTPHALPKNVHAQLKSQRSLRAHVAVIKASDSLQAESGQQAVDALKADGYTVSSFVTVKNRAIRSEIDKLLKNKDIEAIFVVGGTGVSQNDITPETILALPGARELPGFGERHRALTEERWADKQDEIGKLSMLSRATAAEVNGKLIFAIPGSPDAVDIAINDIIKPGLPHLLGNVRRAEH